MDWVFTGHLASLSLKSVCACMHELMSMATLISALQGCHKDVQGVG
jgi:hypothetical protein